MRRYVSRPHLGTHQQRAKLGTSSSLVLHEQIVKLGSNVSQSFLQRSCSCGWEVVAPSREMSSGADWYYADGRGNFFQAHQFKRVSDIQGFLRLSATFVAPEEVKLTELKGRVEPGWYTFDGHTLLNYPSIEVPAPVLSSLQPWADPLDPSLPDYTPGRSLVDKYEFDEQKRPLWPVKEHPPITALPGRGKLGNWGPNQAADPIILIDHFTNGTQFETLDAILIQRQDTHQWAIPGGMVDKDDRLPARGALREFLEEAFGGQMDVDEFDDFVEQHKVFTGKVYQGYVDMDPRNTYHAWMETTAFTWVLNGAQQLSVIELYKVAKKKGTGAAPKLQKSYVYVGGREDEFAKQYPKLPVIKVSLLDFFCTNMVGGDDAKDVKLAPLITKGTAVDVALYANHSEFVYGAVLKYMETAPQLAEKISPGLTPLKARIEKALAR